MNLSKADIDRMKFYEALHSRPVFVSVFKIKKVPAWVAQYGVESGDLMAVESGGAHAVKLKGMQFNIDMDNRSSQGIPVGALEFVSHQQVVTFNHGPYRGQIDWPSTAKAWEVAVNAK